MLLESLSIFRRQLKIWIFFIFIFFKSSALALYFHTLPWTLTYYSTRKDFAKLESSPFLFLNPSPLPQHTPCTYVPFISYIKTTSNVKICQLIRKVSMYSITNGSEGSSIIMLRHPSVSPAKKEVIEHQSICKSLWRATDILDCKESYSSFHLEEKRQQVLTLPIYDESLKTRYATYSRSLTLAVHIHKWREIDEVSMRIQKRKAGKKKQVEAPSFLGKAAIEI